MTELVYYPAVGLDGFVAPLDGSAGPPETLRLAGCTPYPSGLVPLTYVRACP